MPIRHRCSAGRAPEQPRGIYSVPTPMTLLLRPFDFETLATFAYQFAKDEMLEEAALPSLMIVIVGLVPVLLMNRMLRQSR